MPALARRVLALAWLSVSAAATAPAARAQTVLFRFSYAGPGVTVSGFFQTRPFTSGLYPGMYHITGISGERNGVAITGLSFFLFPDQVLYYPATDTGDGLNPTQLDNAGFSYVTGNGQPFPPAFNVFTSCCRPTVVELRNEPRDPGRDVVFSATPVVAPEPAVAALLGAGLVGVGVLSARRRRWG